MQWGKEPLVVGVQAIVIPLKTTTSLEPLPAAHKVPLKKAVRLMICFTQHRNAELGLNT